MASFWSDASPVTKLVIVIGILAFAYLGVAFAVNLPPFAAAPETVQTRGIPPQ
jgi:hypothetical protein